MPQLLTKRQAVLVGTGLAGLRIALGVGAAVKSDLALKPWIGSQYADDKAVKVLARGLAARDIALGVGAVLAQRHGGPVRGWIEAGALADSGDLVATLAAWKHLPVTKWGIVALTLGAVVAGGLVAPCIDED